MCQSVNCVTLWVLGDISPKISSWSPLLTTDQSVTHWRLVTQRLTSLATHAGLQAATASRNNGVSLLFVILWFPSNRTQILFSQPLSIKIGFILNPVVFENIYVTFTSEPSAVSRADSSRLSSLGPPPPPCRESRPPTPSSATWTWAAGHTLTPTEQSLIQILCPLHSY